MQRGFFDDAPQQAGPEGSKPNNADKVRADPNTSLEECLKLLRGPGDERRFVGLLMVTQALPAGDEATIRQVYSAVGPEFLSRLLLPLRSGRIPDAPLSPETAQKQAAMASLGLAVLSAVARVPDLASAPEMLENLPLFLSVARTGGVTRLIAAAKHTTNSQQQQNTTSAMHSEVQDSGLDDAAVHDALECAVAVVASSTDGQHIAGESAALSAAAAVLRRCAAGRTSIPGVHNTTTTTTNIAAAAAAGYPDETAAIHLVSTVLSSPQRGALISQHPTVIQELLPLLAALFALPAALPKKDEEARRSAAQIHLEAMHALLLLLPLPFPEGRVAQESLAQTAHRATWPLDICRGVGLVLRSRAGVIQRHSALQLAAGACAVAGPLWLTQDESFFQLLVEVTKIETSVLFHDALSPLVSVPLAREPGISAANWEAPLSRDPASNIASGQGDTGKGGIEIESDEEDSYSEDGEGPSNPQSDSYKPSNDHKETPADLAGLKAMMSSDSEQAAMAQRVKQQGRPPGPGDVVALVESVEVPTEMSWDGPCERAGDRALRMLPICFTLLEAEVEALGEDEEASGAAAYIASNSGQESASDFLGEEQQGPCLSDEVAERAFHSLQEAAEVLLQFLEQTLAGEDEDKEDKEGNELENIQGGGSSKPPTTSKTSKPSNLLTVGAVRVLGKFCSDVPGAFGPRVRAILPHLLAVHTSEDSAEGVAFLLPLLAQVTSPDRDAFGGELEEEWLGAVLNPSSLRQIVDYAIDAAIDSSTAILEASTRESGAALATVLRVLLNVVSQAPIDTTQLKDSAKVLEALYPLISPLSEALLAPTNICDDESTPEDVLDHAALLACGGALLASILAVVAQCDKQDKEAENARRIASGKKKISGDWECWGIGPLGPEEVEQACKAIVGAVGYVHTALTATLSPSVAHEVLDEVDEEVRNIAQEDFCNLVEFCRELTKTCPPFATVVGSLIGGGSGGVADIERALSAMQA